VPEGRGGTVSMLWDKGELYATHAAKPAFYAVSTLFYEKKVYFMMYNYIGDFL